MFSKSYKRLIPILLMLLVGGGYYLMAHSAHCPYPGLRHSDLDALYVGIPSDEIVHILGTPLPKSFYLYHYSLCTGEKVVLRFSAANELAGGWIIQPSGLRVDLFTRESLLPRVSEDFDFLYRGIRYVEVTEILGEPNAELGSGSHMVVYELADGHNIILTLGIREDQWEYIVIEAYLGSEVEGTLIDLLK